MLLASCNPVLGLDSTKQVDAAFYDAPPPQCPELGSAPVFSRSLTQTLFQNCTDYTVSADGRALGLCGRKVSEGHVGRPLVPAVGLETPVDHLYTHPRLHPDGNIATVRDHYVSTQTNRVVVYERGDAGWEMRAAIPAMNSLSATALTRDRRLLFVEFTRMVEYADDGNFTFTPTSQVHTNMDLGVAFIGEHAHVTPDGLRIIFLSLGQDGMPRLVYSDRETVNMKFGKAQPMPNVEYFPNGVMTEGCERLYVWDLDTVFYSELVTSR